MQNVVSARECVYERLKNNLHSNKQSSVMFQAEASDGHHLIQAMSIYELDAQETSDVVARDKFCEIPNKITLPRWGGWRRFLISSILY